MFRHHSISRFVKTACVIALAFASAYLRADSATFTQTNLVSDVPGLANTTDPHLQNPWGVSFAATSPFWVSNQANGTSTLYDGAGNINPLVVTIPPGATPPSGPTGQVFNGGPGFLLGNGNPSVFIFDTLNGTIAGWNGGTSATQMASTPGAVYTGLARNTSGGSTFLYAADSAGQIHVFNSSWTDVTGTLFAGKFVDSSLPAGFAPFNIQTIGSNLYVTYAALTPMGSPLPGGFVDEYDANGNFIKRVATGGPLSAPWGITLAPAGFGAFSNDLLVGNFGSGQILAYDPTTDALLGTINGANGQPIVNPFLWALETRTGGSNVDTNAVYFTAGINNQKDGLFGEISLVPEPATIFETAFGLVAVVLSRFSRNLPGSSRRE
jgi:uncharacterized protein (TIGR03118 family)